MSPLFLDARVSCCFRLQVQIRKEQALLLLCTGSSKLKIQATLDLSPLLWSFCQRDWAMTTNSDDQGVLWSLRLPTSNQLCLFWELKVSPVPGVYNLAYSCQFAEWWSRVTWTLRTIWYFQCIFQGFTLCWPRVPLLSWRMSGGLYFPGGPMVKTPTANAGATSSIPSWGTKTPCAMLHGQKILKNGMRREKNFVPCSVCQCVFETDRG